MKFLMELGYCFGSGTVMSDRNESDSMGNPRREERRVRARMGPSASAPEEWKPSLGPISEEMVLAEKKRSDGAVNRKSRGSKARVHGRSHSHDFGRSNHRQVIPAFSPAPFMF